MDSTSQQVDFRLFQEESLTSEFLTSSTKQMEQLSDQSIYSDVNPEGNCLMSVDGTIETVVTYPLPAQMFYTGGRDIEKE